MTAGLVHCSKRGDMIEYRPFFKSASRHAMGIKALDPADWLQFGDDGSQQLRTRRQLLDERPDDVLAALPGSEAAQEELLELLLNHLDHIATDRYRISDDEVIERGTGWSCRRAAISALGLAGRLVQEDLCLLQRRQGRYVLIAAVLCFPAHWSLEEKLGKPLIDIHAPVPGFAEQLGSPVERLFDKLDVRRPVERLNWSLVDTDTLYLPPAHRRHRVAIDPERIGDRLRLRVERQTLRRLARSKAVIFGIRTYVTPLADVIDGPEAADALLRRLDEMPRSMQSYKNLIDVMPALITYLRQQCN